MNPVPYIFCALCVWVTSGCHPVQSRQQTTCGRFITFLPIGPETNQDSYITTPRSTVCKLLKANLIKHKVVWVEACNHVSKIQQQLFSSTRQASNTIIVQMSLTNSKKCASDHITRNQITCTKPVAFNHLWVRGSMGVAPSPLLIIQLRSQM